MSYTERQITLMIEQAESLRKTLKMLPKMIAAAEKNMNLAVLAISALPPKADVLNFVRESLQFDRDKYQSDILKFSQQQADALEVIDFIEKSLKADAELTGKDTGK